LANAAGGAWVLAKVDVDANQRIAQALQVQSIPAVFAAIGGQFVPGFQGALPEAQVREFLDAVVQAGEQAGIRGATAATAADGGEPTEAEAFAAPPLAPEPPEDPRFVAAEAAIEAGDYETAAARYRAILDQEPANQEAQLALGQVRLMQRLETLDPSVAARAESDPADVDAQLAAADLSFAGNDVDAALGRLLRTVAGTSGDDRERVRLRLVEYFDLLGPEDPRVPAARRQLARSLF
jgi:putative thioredoxin